MAGPETLVEAPPLLPPTSGLLQVAQVVEHAAGDDRWFAGIRWAPVDDRPVELATVCWGGLPLSDARSTSAPVGGTIPFAVIAHDSCIYGSYTEAEMRARAVDSLKAQEPAAVEGEFERGALIPTNARLAQASAAHQYLASPANTQAGQLALSPKDALAVLDEGIARWAKGLGMIHAPAYVIAQWVAARAVNVADFGPGDLPLDPKPRLLFSPNGNPIVAGSGYYGASPDLAVIPDLTPAGHAAMWAYATGLVIVHREAEPGFLTDDVGQSLNRQNNELTFRAYRMYAVEWSRLLHASVKIATPLVAAP